MDEDSTALTDAQLETRRAIEAVVMAATEPVEPRLLAELVEIPVKRVEEICAELAEEYEREGRGFVLARVAGGYRYQTHTDLVAYVERFVLEGRHARLSPAALETLAIVAYKQPVSRAQVSAIRGVDADGVLRTLLARGYVAEIGTDPGPGRATLYGTTREFLERVGLDSLRDLPPLADFVPAPDVVDALERGLRVERDASAAIASDADGVDAVDAVDAVDGEAEAGDAPDASVAPDAEPTPDA
jgi:segregation and condensation protein B